MTGIPSMMDGNDRSRRIDAGPRTVEGRFGAARLVDATPASGAGRRADGRPSPVSTDSRLDSAELTTGTVVRGCAGGTFVIRTRAGGEVGARSSVSCLLVPEPNDVVLFACISGEARIIAVLERNSDAPLQLSTERDTRWNVKQGGFAVRADGPISFTTSDLLTAVAGKARVVATEGFAAFASLSVAARAVVGHVGTLKVAAEWIETVATRVAQTARHSLRVVEQTEHVRAREIDMVASQGVTVRADSALISARTLTKVNGKQVHIG